MTRTTNKGLLVVFALLGLIFTQACASAGSEPSYPEILKPDNGAKIGGADDEECAPAPEPCFELHVEGRVPSGLTPFLAVAPEKASPSIWIQSPVLGVRRDRTFGSGVYLGTGFKGARERYKLFVFACENERRFHQGQVLTKLPKDCEVSDAVEVFRVR